MDEPALRQLLDDVRSGVVAPDDAAARLRRLPFADLGFARVDPHRALRQRIAEAVYGPGKTAEQCASIVAELVEGPGGGPVLLTRATDEQADAAMALVPGGVRTGWTVVWRPRAGGRPRRGAGWGAAGGGGARPHPRDHGRQGHPAGGRGVRDDPVRLR